MRMFARCFDCRRFNLVWERVDQMISCKQCGSKIYTGIDNLVSEQYKNKILMDEILEFRNKFQSSHK